MQPFHALTPRGKTRRLRLVALNALDQYHLSVHRLRLLSTSTNTLFRVDAKNGKKYVLRVCAPGWRTESDLRREIAWLLSLEHETEIGAPLPLPSLVGEYFVYASAPGIDGLHRCLLMTWVPGVPLQTRLDETHLFRMGELFARLHIQAASFTPPHEPNPRRMDHYLARDEPRCLFTPENDSAFSPNARQVIQRVNERVLAAFQRLYADPAGLRIIHNDLWHGNLKVFRGRLYPFDFEDSLWGYPVQDIAMAMQDLMDDTSPERFEPLQEAFRRGYTHLASWPESHPGQVDDFRAGRLLWVANYVAWHQRQFLAEHLERLLTLFEPYLETGLLRKPPKTQGV